MPRGKPLRNPNGYGSVSKLAGRRRKPYIVKVNTQMTGDGAPVYDILGYFEDRVTANIALAKYNENPYDISAKKLTFSDVYDLWYKRKFESSIKTFSQSTINCTKGAYRNVSLLHGVPFCNIRTAHMQEILDTDTLSHAYMEHVKNLFSQMYKYALEYDIVEKDYSKFVRINKENDDKPGVPFTPEEIALLWQHTDIPFVDTVLIYIYSGWRVTELLQMPLEDIDLVEWTFKGGIKTAASKDRIVPIHTLIRPMVSNLAIQGQETLIYINGHPTLKNGYYVKFKAALKACGIITKHTPHDCRHTFTTLLDNAGANPVCIDRLLGHVSSSITSKTYTHKDIEELRKAIELIK